MSIWCYLDCNQIDVFFNFSGVCRWRLKIIFDVNLMDWTCWIYHRLSFSNVKDAIHLVSSHNWRRGSAAVVCRLFSDFSQPVCHFLRCVNKSTSQREIFKEEEKWERERKPTLRRLFGWKFLTFADNEKGFCFDNGYWTTRFNEKVKFRTCFRSLSIVNLTTASCDFKAFWDFKDLLQSLSINQ